MSVWRTTWGGGCPPRPPRGPLIVELVLLVVFAAAVLGVLALPLLLGGLTVLSASILAAGVPLVLAQAAMAVREVWVELRDEGEWR